MLNVSGHAEKNKMENPLDNLIGLYCLESYRGYAGHLKVLCSKYPDTITLITNDLAKPEFQFETESAAWRLLKGSELLTGIFEDPEHNDKFLNTLVGRKILEIEKNTTTDFSLIFEDNYRIDTFNQGLDFPPITFHNSVEETWLCLTNQGQWIVPTTEGLTEEEEIQSDHATNTHERWKEIVPKKSFDNHCVNCAYFLSTSGESYFWDYGICSNSKSQLDGKVVGVRSTCGYFDFELKNDK